MSENNKRIKNYGERTNKAMKTWMKVVRTFHKFSNKEIAYFNENELTFNQFKVLEVLYHKGDLNIGSITKLTMSTPGNITVVVRNLKRDGWIKSISDKEDKRVSILSITEKGLKKMDEIFPRHSENLRNIMQVLNDEELDTLHKLLNKVYKQ